MEYDIVTYGDPQLRKEAEPVSEVGDELRTMVDDMIVTMRMNNGVGLAAEQIGRKEAICVIDVTSAESDGVEMPLALVNPKITEERGESVDTEGCLSFPEIFVSVPRAEAIDVEYMDINNKPQKHSFHGLAARVILHEVDHLNGVLLVDRMSAVQKVAVSGKLKRLKKSWKDS